MNAHDQLFEKTCAELCASFFTKYPNDELRNLADQALAALRKLEMEFPGQAAGWAAGIVYAVGCSGCGVPDVLNADFEKAFGTTMSTIRRRAAQVRRTLEAGREKLAEAGALGGEWTLRDEANAVCAYAFRNGPLERIHHQYNISNLDMKEFNINASEHLAKLMAMKKESPEEYERFIRHYHSQFCGRWER